MVYDMINLKIRNKDKFKKIVKIIDDDPVSFHKENLYIETIKEQPEIYINLCLTYVKKHNILKILLKDLIDFKNIYSNFCQKRSIWGEDSIDLYYLLLQQTDDVNFLFEELVITKLMKIYSNQFQKFLFFKMENKDLHYLKQKKIKKILEDFSKTNLLKEAIKKSDDITFFKHFFNLFEEKEKVDIYQLLRHSRGNVEITEFLLKTFKIDLKNFEKGTNTLMSFVGEHYSNVSYVKLKVENKVLDMIKTLVKYNANIQDLKRQIKYILKDSTDELLKYFIKENVFVEETIQHCIATCNTNIIQYIEDFFPDVLNTSKCLYIAVELDITELIHHFLGKEDVNINSRIEVEQKKHSILSVAKNIDVIKLLIEKGAVIKGGSLTKHINNYLRTSSYPYDNKIDTEEKFFEIVVYLIDNIKNINNVNYVEIFDNIRIKRLSKIYRYILENKKELTNKNKTFMFSELIKNQDQYSERGIVYKDELEYILSFIDKKFYKEYKNYNKFHFEKLFEENIKKGNFKSAKIIIENFIFDYTNTRIYKDSKISFRFKNYDLKQLKKLYNFGLKTNKNIVKYVNKAIAIECIEREQIFDFADKNQERKFIKLKNGLQDFAFKSNKKRIKKIIKDADPRTLMSALQEEKKIFTLHALKKNVLLKKEDVELSLFFKDNDLIDKVCNNCEQNNYDNKLNLDVGDLSIEVLDLLVKKEKFNNTEIISDFIKIELYKKEKEAAYKNIVHVIKKYKVDIRNITFYYSSNLYEECISNKHGELLLILFKEDIAEYNKEYVLKVIQKKNLFLYKDIIKQNNKELFSFKEEQIELATIVSFLKYLVAQEEFDLTKETLILLKDSYNLIDLYNQMYDSFHNSLLKQLIFNVFNNSKSITIKDRKLMTKFKKEFQSYLNFKNCLNNFKKI